ncbi:hypothetical protein C7974DRAFT_401726 [Boeremia exigua]|uniref:uncharacterized protein n=1 Tax=Boeremia exigua TaxID=749465 RepID=UPI001E8E9AAD|nr:uncharacterized protein C7974DRAFT_401726 [Boeremia exigua]KAH6616393.1 hypothetical protein C7974DRAFT_401726 [Boeremia exigua]
MWYQVHELEGLFRDLFRFSTQIVDLDVSSKPQHQLDRHVMTFIESNDGPNNLLIVYYQGHSVYRELYNRLELSASNIPVLSVGLHRSAFVSWRKTEELLRSDGVDGDVLTILDTSFASNMAENGKANLQITSTQKLFELLSACPENEITDPPGPNSFTRALIDTLSELAKTSGSRPFTTAQVTQRIRMKKTRKETPPQLFSFLSKDRHIVLSPAKVKEDHSKNLSWPQTYARSYLRLGMAFRDELLNEEQIEFLVSNLAKALKDVRFIGLRKIDWLGIEIRPTVQLEPTGWAKTAVARWKEVVRESRLKRRENTLARRCLAEYPDTLFRYLSRATAHKTFDETPGDALLRRQTALAVYGVTKWKKYVRKKRVAKLHRTTAKQGQDPAGSSEIGIESKVTRQKP